MKKILHLTHTDIKTDSRILKEMSALVNAGYKLFGIGIDLEEGAAESPISFNAEIEGIKLHSRQFKSIPRSLRHFLSLFEVMVKMLPRSLRLKPDVIHCHDTLVLPLGVLVKLFTGAKLVYDAHELESNRNGITKFQGKITFYIEKILWRYIDALIVVSPSIQKWYIEKIGDKLSAVILNSPVFELSSKDYSDNYLHKKFNIPNDCLVFIYIGILGRGRGLDYIIEAFSAKGVKSHVVFLGFGEYYDRIEKLVSSKNNFHLHKAVPHSQVVPIAKSANFGLCLIENISLSDYLCLPNKLFEYCFAGVPVLASDFPDIRNIIDKYNAGECCDFEIGSIVNAIKKMENGSSKYFSKNLNELGWQSQEYILTDLYDKL